MTNNKFVPKQCLYFPHRINEPCQTTKGNIKPSLVPAVVAIASILFATACTKTESPTSAVTPEPSKVELHPNTIKEFSFPGGSFKDGRVIMDPGTKIEPGPKKNVVTLMRQDGNGLSVSCFCILEGGDCWAVSSDCKDQRVCVGCADQNCAGGGEPFCFMEINDPFGRFAIRLAVAAKR